jgi:hypothetical protein
MLENSFIHWIGMLSMVILSPLHAEPTNPESVREVNQGHRALIGNTRHACNTSCHAGHFGAT